jgi:hypothetical protein
MRTNPLPAALLLALIPTLAIAATPTGKLAGTVAQANTDVNTTATFSGTGNDRSVVLNFGDPYGCNITAPFVKEDTASATFRFRASTSSGGWCDRLKPDVIFKPADAVDGKAAWRIDFSSKNNDWTGTLVQATGP